MAVSRGRRSSEERLFLSAVGGRDIGASYESVSEPRAERSEVLVRRGAKRLLPASESRSSTAVPCCRRRCLGRRRGMAVQRSDEGAKRHGRKELAPLTPPSRSVVGASDRLAPLRRTAAHAGPATEHRGSEGQGGIRLPPIRPRPTDPPPSNPPETSVLVRHPLRDGQPRVPPPLPHGEHGLRKRTVGEGADRHRDEVRRVVVLVEAVAPHSGREWNVRSTPPSETRTYVNDRPLLCTCSRGKRAGRRRFQCAAGRPGSGTWRCGRARPRPWLGAGRRSTLLPSWREIVGGSGAGNPAGSPTSPSVRPVSARRGRAAPRTSWSPLGLGAPAATEAVPQLPVTSANPA